MKENDAPRSLAKHRAEVLARLRPGRPAYRNELARETGLSPATVSRIARSLLRGRVLREVPAPSPAVGRPVRGLEINGDAGWVMGLSGLYPAVRVAVMNLRGDVLREEAAPFDSAVGARGMLDLLKRTAKDVLRRSKRFLGVGLALPGQWSRDEGVSIRYPRVPDWKDVPIRRLLEEWTGGPATLIGYAPALAVAEQARGGSEPRNLLCAEVAENIAMGVIANGAVLEGASGNAGELGHILVDPKGPVCYCGNRGCLESYATGSAAAEEAKASTFDVLLKRRDEASARILRKVGRALGAGLSTALNLFNPEILVLNGRLFDAEELVLQPLRDALKEHAISSSLRGLRIERSALGPSAPALGAGLAAIREALVRL
ncbi:MAG TPA: ROK family transcriptional regulator [Planctomycetota bacterium]